MSTEMEDPYREDEEDFQEPFPSPNRVSSWDEDPSAHFERLQGGRQASKLHARERREVLAQLPESEQRNRQKEAAAIRNRHVAESMHAMMLNGDSDDVMERPVADKKSNGYTGYNNTTDYASRHRLHLTSRRGKQSGARAVSDPLETVIIDPDKIILSQPQRAHDFRSDRSVPGRSGPSDPSDLETGSLGRDSMAFKNPRRVDAHREDHGRAAQAPTQSMTKREHRPAGRVDSVAVGTLGSTSDSIVQSAVAPASVRLSSGTDIPISSGMRGDAIARVATYDSANKNSAYKARSRPIKSGDFEQAFGGRNASSVPRSDMSSSVRAAPGPIRRTVLGGHGNDRHSTNVVGSRVSAHNAVCHRMESIRSQSHAPVEQAFHSHELVSGDSRVPRRGDGQRSKVMSVSSGAELSRISEAPPITSNSRSLNKGWSGTDTMSTVADASRPSVISGGRSVKRREGEVGSTRQVTTDPEGAVSVSGFARPSRPERLDGTMKPRAASSLTHEGLAQRGEQRASRHDTTKPLAALSSSVHEGGLAHRGEQMTRRHPVAQEGQARAAQGGDSVAPVRVSQQHKPSARVAVREDGPRGTRVVEASLVPSHSVSNSRSSQVARDVSDTGGIFASDIGQHYESEHRDTTNARGQQSVNRTEAVQSHFVTQAMTGAPPETTTRRNDNICYDEAPPRVTETISTPRYLPREFTETSSARGMGDSSWMPDFGGEKMTPRVQHGDSRKARTGDAMGEA